MGVWVDNVFYKVNFRFTIFQFCYLNNIYLPYFCYHEKLSIAGNCRMCLVEANNAIVVSCAMPLLDGIKIFTSSKRVVKARESVLEFLLVNHPLDCPICDQGGECDLQDITFKFGYDRGRFYEYKKRSVENLNCCGPFIKTVMTRCIHCTRCVRFLDEISGICNFGLLGRGGLMEVNTYLSNFHFDELAANVIDICPVGALTSMPYAFTARAWEMTNSENIDVLDSLGSAIRLDIYANKVLRVLPVLDEAVNEDWITNKVRFFYDSLSIQRLNYPKLRLGESLLVVSWDSVLMLVLSFLFLKPFEILEVIFGNFVDLELVLSFKDFFSNFGCYNFSYESNFNFLFDFRFFFLLNNTLNFFENISSLVLIGTNLRLEVPLLNSRIRKNYLKNNMLLVLSLGLALDYLTFPVINFGNSSVSLKLFLEVEIICLAFYFLIIF